MFTKRPKANKLPQSFNCTIITYTRKACSINLWVVLEEILSLKKEVKQSIKTNCL